MKKKILIFAPTYNESGNIIYLLKAIAKLNIKVDILIIDDNSPDNTQDKVIAYSKKRKNIKLIVRKKKDGIGTAHQVAFSYSLKKKYHFLITMDADLSHEPKVIPKILKELKIHPFVICSRYLKKSIVSPTRKSFGCLLPLRTPTPPSILSMKPRRAHIQLNANHPVSPPSERTVSIIDSGLAVELKERRSTSTFPPAHSGSDDSGRAGSL